MCTFCIRPRFYNSNIYNQYAKANVSKAYQIVKLLHTKRNKPFGLSLSFFGNVRRFNTKTQKYQHSQWNYLVSKTKNGTTEKIDSVSNCGRKHEQEQL